MAILQRGASYPAVSDGDVKQHQMLVPPLPEQERIVAILDEAFEAIDTAIANTEQNIANARELFESILNQQFSEGSGSTESLGWQTERLLDITTKIGSGATPKGGQKAYKTEGISLIRSMNVYDDGFRPAKLAFIDDAQAEKLSNVVVQDGDVLLNITGASIARCCVAPRDYLPARVNQHVAIIRPIPQRVHPRFLSFLLSSSFYKKTLLRQGDDAGATRQALTKGMLQEFRVKFPSLSEQERILTILDEAQDAVEELKTGLNAKLTSLAKLKQSILQKAFTGELTVSAEPMLQEARL
jgi:type I restriction enzyme, S subunit